jgi:integrase
VISFAKSRTAVACPSTILMDLSFLSTAVRHAGPALGLAPLTTLAVTEISNARRTLRHARIVGDSVERDRRPTEDELRTLRDHWAAQKTRKIPMWDICLFSIATTMRLGEICSLRWEDLAALGRPRCRQEDDPRPRPEDPKEKKGNDERVPLLEYTEIFDEIAKPMEIIKRNEGLDRTGVRLFPYAPQSVSMTFGRAVDKVGIHDLRFHDLRHDGISRMFEGGFDIPEVAVCSGHKSWDNLKRYTHIKPHTLLDRTAPPVRI